MKISKELGAQVDFKHWHSEVIPSWEEAMLLLNESLEVEKGDATDDG
jgi:uracil DNA glycosylase